MNNIEVRVLDSSNDPGGIMMFLAKLTQRGHAISSMKDLLDLYVSSSNPKGSTIEAVAKLPHGTIKRFCPITVAVVGASRRFLAQARTHQVGFNYVSASLQYSNYTGKARFVVPYALLNNDVARGKYLQSCADSMMAYEYIAADTDNDTAGYAAPQGLRNILIMQANHEAWMNFIRLRSCNRNTVETQYVTLRIWEELLQTANGNEFFRYAGPDCMFGACREGKMSCGDPLRIIERDARTMNIATPRMIINAKWPLLNK